MKLPDQFSGVIVPFYASASSVWELWLLLAGVLNSNFSGSVCGTCNLPSGRTVCSSVETFTATPTPCHSLCISYFHFLIVTRFEAIVGLWDPCLADSAVNLDKIVLSRYLTCELHPVFTIMSDCFFWVKSHTKISEAKPLWIPCGFSLPSYSVVYLEWSQLPEK